MINKQNKLQTIKQRAGKLIEEYVCDNWKLSPNKRQQTRGYFDAYNKENIFEIKAVKMLLKDKNPRITLIKNNHNDLLGSGCGKYCIVNYDLINRDKKLQLIQDIKILREIEISAEDMDSLIMNFGIPIERKYRTRSRQYIRIKINDIPEVHNV